MRRGRFGESIELGKQSGVGVALVLTADCIYRAVLGSAGLQAASRESGCGCKYGDWCCNERGGNGGIHLGYSSIQFEIFRPGVN